jgi:hypothetical protein
VIDGRLLPDESAELANTLNFDQVERMFTRQDVAAQLPERQSSIVISTADARVYRRP